VKILQTPSLYNFYILLNPTPYIKNIRYPTKYTQEKYWFSINGFLNVKAELVPLLVVIDFPYGKLVKTMMFDVYH
jgi:hypothetical protein